MKKVRENNGQIFIDDFKKVSEVMARTETGKYFKILRRDVWESAMEGRVSYMLTRDIYIVRRMVMVVI